MKNRRNVDIPDVNQTSLELVTTELKVGHTFASIALEATDATKRARNRCNARKAYDTVLWLLGHVTLTRTQSVRIKEAFHRLKHDLELLGETHLKDSAVLPK